MRHDHPTTPFDVDADDLTQQFWGSTKGWVSGEQPTSRHRAAPPERRGDDTTGSLRVIREGFAAFRPQTSPNATGEIRRQRQHGAARPAVAPRPPRREATLGELAAGHSDVGGWYDDLDDLDLDAAPIPAARHAPSRPRHAIEGEHDVPLTPAQPLATRLGLGAVDPLLLRAGLIVLALILMVPIALSIRPDRDDTLPGDVVEAPRPVVAGAAPATASTTPPTAPDPTASAPATNAPAPAAAPTASDRATVEAGPASTTATAPSSAPGTTVGADDATVAAASVDATAERVVPTCPQSYRAAAGDSWYRIADAAGVTPTELLAQNNATTETVILPGDDICLPAGASMPAPPTTVAPATTEPSPTDDEPATTSAAPTTTAAATTTVAPAANLTRAEVKALIRETWPANEVETALNIARRESNFVATADNGWCCVGVFQIYWTVHDEWLDDFGIHQRSDLFDARKNIAAAHHMWQQSGWGPWGG